MSKFFSRLSYSFGNEDWRTEQQALKVKPKDRILSITASGDRPLHLLLDDCKELISIDANPIQNHLLDLKCAAMQLLDFDHYLAFLGAVKGGHRLDTFKKIAPHLNEESRKYWKQKQGMIEKGVLYQGFIERKLKMIVAPAFKLFRGKKIQRLFEFTDLKEQQEFVKKDWDKLYWRKTFDIALNSVFSRLLLTKVVDDPGLSDHLEGAASLGTYFYKRMHDSLLQNLAQESILFSLLLKGRVDTPAFPPYLTEKGVVSIKKKTKRIKAYDADILSFLESREDSSIDCFSLSDVASYLSYSDFLKMLKEIQRVATPGARFSIRQFLSNHNMPEPYKKIFVRDRHLEKELEKKDRCFVYRYMTGVIAS
jgi:S-adenosylmethionine-diacylglycerol 3-amino-3-carboxypropyl transferase